MNFETAIGSNWESNGKNGILVRPFQKHDYTYMVRLNFMFRFENGAD